MKTYTAAANIINAHLRYNAAAKSFAEHSGCSVCTRDCIQLTGSGDNRELARILGADVDEMERLDGYWRFSFTYQLVKFVWLEPIEEEK